MATPDNNPTADELLIHGSIPPSTPALEVTNSLFSHLRHVVRSYVFSALTDVKYTRKSSIGGAANVESLLITAGDADGAATRAVKMFSHRLSTDLPRLLTEIGIEFRPIKDLDLPAILAASVDASKICMDDNKAYKQKTEDALQQFFLDSEVKAAANYTYTHAFRIYSAYVFIFSQMLYTHLASALILELAKGNIIPAKPQKT